MNERTLMSNLNIGCHLSISKGYEQMAMDAVSIGANTLQFFIRNPRGAGSKAIEKNDAVGMMDIVKNNHFAKLLVHAPYTMNPCSQDLKTC